MLHHNNGLTSSTQNILYINENGVLTVNLLELVGGESNP